MRKFFMASIVLTSFALSIFLFQISSCTKAEAQAPVVYPIEGLWIGTYSVDGQPGLGTQYFAMSIKPDGKNVVDSKGGTDQHLSPGTWTLNGKNFTSSFTCVYGKAGNVGVTEIFKGIWTDSGTLTGTWENIAPLTGRGNVSLRRIN